MRSDTRAARTNAITHEPGAASATHADAIATVANSPPVRDTDRDTLDARTQGVANLEHLPERDRAALRTLVQFRLLTYHQLRLAAYSTAHPSVTRRRVAQLVRLGLVSTWEAPSRAGGHTRYAIPTPAAVRGMTATLERDTSDAPFAPLVRLMMPSTTRRALTLTPTSQPNWLAHQTEVNTLALRWSGAHRLAWASTWDCPFPSRVASFELPQPDYVLVELRAEGPQLVFGEHDRGSEPTERFIARKALAYAALASFPEACAQFFGLATFRVQITITDPLHRTPLQRLRELLVATRRAVGPDMASQFYFTLAGWLHAAPTDPVWFAANDDPVDVSLNWRDHVGRSVS